mgnify:CR=1 FL=1
MKKNLPFLWSFILILILTACSFNGGILPQINRVTEEIPPTETESIEPVNGATFNPCDLIDETEMEAIFEETPLFVEEIPAGCAVKNQWDTRSIRFVVFRGDQGLSGIKWHTQMLVEGWNNQDYQTLINEIIEDPENQTLRDLQDARLAVYEKLEYRWERIYTIGDSSYWVINPRAFTGFLDVIERDIFLEVGFSGFLAAKIQPVIEGMAKNILGQLPNQFIVQFSPQDEIISETMTPSFTDNAPQIAMITKTASEIFYGDLCGNETTTIRVQYVNYENINSVYIVYRLVSPNETNDNWNTITMSEITPSTWEVILSAETSFRTYKLVDGAKLEYSIAAIYQVNDVLRGPTYDDIIIFQCRAD